MSGQHAGYLADGCPLNNGGYAITFNEGVSKADLSLVNI